MQKNQPQLDPIEINGEEIETVSEIKLLGVTIQSDLKWNTHVNNIVKKASTRLHFIAHLKRAAICTEDLLIIYTSIVRPVLEYACPLWSTGLPTYLSELIENIQKRLLKIIYGEGEYKELLLRSKLNTLAKRRLKLNRDFFAKVKKENCAIHHLLPPKRFHTHDLRQKHPYPIIEAKTNRFQNSFIPYSLIHYQ